MPRLTKRFVDGLVADGRDHDYFDDALKGEPYRVCRRLQLLRDWSHDEINKVFT